MITYQEIVEKELIVQTNEKRPLDLFVVELTCAINPAFNHSKTAKSIRLFGKDAPRYLERADNGYEENLKIESTEVDWVDVITNLIKEKKIKENKEKLAEVVQKQAVEILFE